MVLTLIRSAGFLLLSAALLLACKPAAPAADPAAVEDAVQEETPVEAEEATKEQDNDDLPPNSENAVENEDEEDEDDAPALPSSEGGMQLRLGDDNTGLGNFQNKDIRLLDGGLRQ